MRGVTGIQGATGVQGPQGDAGPTGTTGTQGSVGVDGPQGPTGEVGPRGVQGLTGNQGSTGITGPQGPEGDQGSLGPEGPVGIQGSKGITGSQGPQGDLGPQGQEGSTGDRGPVGLQGVEGERGPVGSQGEQGNQGLEGRQGLLGFDGIDGVDGQDGSNGVNGTDGKIVYIRYHSQALPTVPPKPYGSGYTSSGWTGTASASTNWISQKIAEDNYGGLHGYDGSVWSNPIQISGNPGADGADGDKGATGDDGRQSQTLYVELEGIPAGSGTAKTLATITIPSKPYVRRALLQCFVNAGNTFGATNQTMVRTRFKSNHRPSVWGNQQVYSMLVPENGNFYFVANSMIVSLLQTIPANTTVTLFIEGQVYAQVGPLSYTASSFGTYDPETAKLNAVIILNPT